MINKIFEDLREEQILDNLSKYNDEDKDIGIAFIRLAYKNQTIIKLLIKRGEIISQGGKTSRKNLEKIDEEIDRCFEEDYRRIS